jgi:hypothetical protein
MNAPVLQQRNPELVQTAVYSRPWEVQTPDYGKKGLLACIQRRWRVRLQLVPSSRHLPQARRGRSPVLSLLSRRMYGGRLQVHEVCRRRLQPPCSL